jgi:PAS domain S-box-containing protein
MRVIAAGSVVVLMVLGLFLARPTPVADLDSRVCDLLTEWAGPGKPSGRVVIVEIDEKSLARFGRWPWPRDLVGRLSRRILDAGPAAVALDMMFPQPDGANDELLAGAISGTPAVVGYAFRFDGADVGSPTCPGSALPLALAGPEASAGAAFFHATGVVCSVPAVSQAASASGFLNAAPDRDGTMRLVPVVIEYGNRYYPSLALAALGLYRHAAAIQLATDAWGARKLRLDRQAVPLEGRSSLRLRFRGARRTFRYVSAADVLAGRSPQDLLRGRIVIVGGSAAGMQNPVVTPADPLFPDVEIQATAIDNLLQGDSFRRPGDARFWELALALLAGLFSTLLLARLRMSWGALATLGLAAGVCAVCAFVLSFRGTLFSPLPATVALACNVPVLTLFRYLRERNRAERAQQQLAAATQRSREVLKESESRYRRLVENVNDAIIMDDVEGRLVFANRRFREWFGLQEAEIRNVLLEQYVAPEWRVEMRARHDRRMRGEAVPDHCEFEGIRPDGTRISIEALVTTVEENGRITGSQSALRDATGRKRMEAQYLQAQKMESVGRLAGGVAHDFNNLLTVINGYSAMLLGHLPEGDRSKQGLEQILQAGERAAELTQKLLTFSRKQLVRPGPLNLNLLVAEAREMFNRVIGEDIELITRLSPDLGSVIADPGQIHQVLMNLVVNARDAMPNGGTVTVETRNAEADAGTSFVCLGVTDTGSGMSDEVKQHLFEPFFTTKDQGKGTGLGLATVYGIVHQNGGRIEVTSELGRGTAFHIYLPRIKPALPEQPDASAAAPSLQGSETVLIVEDQDAVRQLATTILESYGYRVLQASNGPEAIALAESYRAAIHLLLTDIILPLMDGRVLADKLRAVRPETKILYISGYSEEKIGRSNPLDGDLAYLSKPFTSQALALRVREILAGGGGQRHGAGDSS